MNWLRSALGALTRSLRWRLLLATWLGLLLALVLAGLVLGALFRDHVLQQFRQGLQVQLDQVTAVLKLDAQNRPVLDARALSDPRWQRPLSGLYWQIDQLTPAPEAAAVLRSRSLWDSQLDAQPLTPWQTAGLAPLQTLEAEGPGQRRVLLLARTVTLENRDDLRWRVMVAADLAQTDAAVAGFNRVLALSLGVLLLLLGTAAWLQVRVGLGPLQALLQEVQALRAGQRQRLAALQADEVQPLVQDFNAVLDWQEVMVQQARTQAGNLAHAIKTPLTVLDQAAQRAADDQVSAPLVREQVGQARRHIDWHLSRARRAVTAGQAGWQTEVGPVVDGLVRVMRKVHAERALQLGSDVPAGLCFAGETQDLQEMLGNLMDNACKWAQSRVHVRARVDAAEGLPRLQIDVEDDGPGIAPEHHHRVKERGQRLDESVPGSGLGLAIVQDAVELYGGQMALRPLSPRGLQVRLLLPLALNPVADRSGC